MLSSEALLHQRFQNRRPGLQLMAIEDAALPVTVVGTSVLAQERKSFPLLHEFVLRLIDAGVAGKSEIASYLGIESSLVDSAIAEQVSADNLTYNAASSRVLLTARGKNSVRDLESVQPVHVPMHVVFDRLVWSLAPYSRGDLITKREAQDRGLMLLPPSKTARIALDDVPASGINAMLKVKEGTALRREILLVKQIRPHTHRYFPIKLLVYGDIERGEVELAAVIDGDASPQHDRALNGIGGAEVLGIRVGLADDRPILSEELEALRVPIGEIEGLRSATIDGRIAASNLEAAAISDPNPTSHEELSLSKISVRSVSVFEHRDLLVEALETAQRRILLISPWIKATVVDSVFIERLERRLRQGVPVTIAYGIGENDKGSDETALNRLHKLSKRYESKFRFVRLANTHAKVLIFDDYWISTSFNWLSFRGDPERTYRMEEGTLVQLPGQVTAQYEHYLDLIAQQKQT